VELDPGKSEVERAKCIGCGVCVIKCPTDAIKLEPVSAEEWFHTPASMAEWEERRLAFLASEKK
jgi:ferredoxin